MIFVVRESFIGASEYEEASAELVHKVADRHKISVLELIVRLQKEKIMIWVDPMEQLVWYDETNWKHRLAKWFNERF